MHFNFLQKIRYSPFGVSLRSRIPHKIINRFKHFPLAVLANLFYNWPSKKLKMIGVTGTDGKTTTASLIYHILNSGGKKVALISTVSAKVGKKEIDTGFHVTSPSPFKLQRLLRQIADKGYQYVVLETTSHGLAQYRVWGINFLVSVVTNITEDHFLYHKTWKEYLEAKARLFKTTKYSILNIEDKSYKFLKKLAKGKIVTYGLKKGDFNLLKFQFKTKLPGDFNKLNCLAAIAVASVLGIKQQVIKKALINFSGVKGRMEVIQEKPFKLVVDFAHTPNALKQALITLRAYVKKGGKLIAVFGCAGERDKGRRKMGKVAAELADIIIITAEDPRTEGVCKISNDIARWAKKAGAREAKTINSLQTGKKLFIKINDREQAIVDALKIAKKGDVVGIFGKGHERSMCFGTTEYPWADQQIAKQALKRLSNTKNFN